MAAGNKKYGRNKNKCTRYTTEGRLEKNKKRRANRRAKREMKLEVLRERRIKLYNKCRATGIIMSKNATLGHMMKQLNGTRRTRAK